MAKKTTSKTAAKASAKKTETPAAAAKPAVVVKETPVIAAPTLRKKDFIDQVVKASGGKKKDVKPIVEAALRELGNALSDGNDLQLPPLGKLKIHKRKELAGAEMLMLKLRRSNAVTASSGNDPVADAAE